MEIRTEKRALDKIYKRRDRYDIPDWQRQVVWSRSKKQLLIDSILRGWKLPKFYLVKTSSDPNEYEVVDGQQRLMAILDFFDNELPLRPASAKKFGGEYYKNLPEALTDLFDDFEIEFDEIIGAEEHELKEFFQRLQEGLPLTSSEKLNSVHSKLRDFCRKLSKHQFFKEKITASDKRYGHFDIVAKVAAIEIEGIETSLRYDDLKTTFDSQASFSGRSNVAKRLRMTFDFLDRVFPGETSILRKRTIVQSFATLASRVIQTGKYKGTEKQLREFFAYFMEELTKQVTLGQKATDPEYLAFQKTINANIRRSAQIRNEILLRKLLIYDRTFTDIVGISVIAESAIEKSIAECGERIRKLVALRNEEYAMQKGKDLFKATNKTAQALAGIGSCVSDYNEYSSWIDTLYHLFRESAGTRLQGNWPRSFADVNILRTAERHDVDHGRKTTVKSKRIRFGNCFKKYAGVTTPTTLEPEKFALVQARLLAEIEKDLRILRWK